MDSHELSMCIILLVLITLSACFSSTETAFTSVNGIRLKNMAKEGSAKATLAYEVYKQGTAAITTILIGNNIVNILATAIATDLFMNVVGPAGVALATGVMTVTILIFGEITPKIVAKSKPENIAMLMARPMKILMVLFYPITKVIVGAESKWEAKKDISNVTATENELLEIVNTIEQEGALEQDERELIENVIEFDDTSVRDVMVSRENVIWVYDNAPYDDLAKMMQEHKLSRFPVISHETLNIVGIVHVRDVFDTLLSKKEVSITDIMSEPMSLSQRKKLPEALQELQKTRTHMAVVTESAKIDNFVGIVTLEDIIEELVGEIYDEHDTLPDHVIEIGLHTYEVEGQVNLTQFFDQYLDDLEMPVTKAKTIGQWIFEINGNKKVRKGREIEFENFEIKVLETLEGYATRAEITVYTAQEDDE